MCETWVFHAISMTNMYMYHYVLMIMMETIIMRFYYRPLTIGLWVLSSNFFGGDAELWILDAHPTGNGRQYTVFLL